MNQIRTTAILFLIALTSCSPGSYATFPETQVPAFADKYPCFSPDGDSIAFVHWTPNWGDTVQPTGLYIVGAGGGKPRLVFPGSIIQPDWSPDGRWIAFVAAYGGPLYVISPAGDSLRQVTTFSGFSPSWSPDGSELLFATDNLDPRGGRVLWIVPFDGGPPRDISEHGTGEWINGDWSPDGQHIVHERYLTGVSDTELFIMDRNGGGGRRLTYNSLRDGEPAWSPRDSLIAWTQAMGICVMRTDGTGAHIVTSGSRPAWSPDGATIALSREVRRSSSSQPGAELLFVIGANGSGLRQITFE